MATVNIYQIVDEDDNILYIGKTIDMIRREQEHRSKTGRNECATRFIPEDIVWDMELIEVCPKENGKEREEHYIEVKQPLYNVSRPMEYFRQKEEYQEKKARVKSMTAFVKRFNGSVSS